MIVKGPKGKDCSWSDPVIDESSAFLGFYESF
jgi:hypothetical protein